MILEEVAMMAVNTLDYTIKKRAYLKFESEVYPKICAEVRRLGQIARESGLPRVCNLGEEYQSFGELPRIYLEPWMQGYDGIDPNRELEEFIKVEKYLDTLPLHKLNEEDL